MAKITYLNEDLYEKVKKEADKKFEKDSYVKNMWILKEYEKRGGKTNKEGKKPSDKQVKKSVKGYEINLDLWEFEVAEDKDYSNYCEEFSLETEKIIAEDSEEKISEVYSKYKKTVNMSYSSLKKWSENPCSKTASLSRGPIERNLRLLSKKKSEWTMSDVKSANRTISFVSRMKGAEQGEKTTIKKDGGKILCPSKRDVSLMNWAYKP